jgi:hypothetical protein
MPGSKIIEEEKSSIQGEEERPIDKYLQPSTDIAIVTQLIREFVFQNQVTIERATQLNGGWEGWLQVELALFLKDKHELSVIPANVDREQMVYADSDPDADPESMRVDICYQHQKDQANIGGAFIELKAESRKSDKQLVRTKYMKDLEKVVDWKLVDKYRPGRLWSLMFICSVDYVNALPTETLKRDIPEGRYGYMVAEPGLPVMVYYVCSEWQE